MSQNWDVPSTMPKVSVIIVSHNRPALLRRSIASALSQDYSDFELIIVDDSSNNEPQKVVNSFEDPRIKCIRIESEITPSAADNVGIKSAHGDYITFLDDDDEWLPTKLSKQVMAFGRASSSVGLIYTGINYIDEVKGTRKIFLPIYRGRVFDQLLLGCFIRAQSSVMIRREVLADVNGFDEALQSIHDWDLYLRIAKNYEFDYVPEVLVNYYYNYVGLTSNVEKQLQGQSIVYGKIGNQIKSEKVWSNIYFRRGVLLFKHGDHLEGRRCLMKSLLFNWKNLKALSLIVLSIMGSATFNKMYSIFESTPLATYLSNISSYRSA
jgi:glycosyltransferase involved in cell wall biosynthesis